MLCRHNAPLILGLKYRFSVRHHTGCSLLFCFQNETELSDKPNDAPEVNIAKNTLANWIKCLSDRVFLVSGEGTVKNEKRRLYKLISFSGRDHMSAVDRLLTTGNWNCDMKCK